MADLNVRNRTIFCYDNLDVLRGINDECIDLIYLDPPFNKNKQFAAPIGREAEGAAFKDMFREEDIKDEWLGQMADQYPLMFEYLNGISNIGHSSNKYYLCFMAIRLIEIRRVLKKTGSVYLHCDQTMSHYLKLLLDCIFGESNFRNEIVWVYGLGGSSKKKYSQKHDTLYFYSKTVDYYFTKPSIPATSQMLAGKLKGATDVFNIPSLNNMAKERTGYPTQKPIKLLERIIEASSDKEDVVLDPFCGCATTCVAAERLARRWVGIDISKKAYDLVNMRLKAELPVDLFHNKVNMQTEPPRRTDGRVIEQEDALKKNGKKQILYGQQNGYCVGCGYWFRFRNLMINRIDPNRNDDLENLQLLCYHCSFVKGNGDNRYLRGRLRELGFVNDQRNLYK